MSLTSGRKREIVDPDSRHKRLADAPPLIEDLKEILATPTGRTLERFITEVAALATHTSANSSPNPNEIRSTGEPPIPSFRPAWASKRLDRLDLLLHEETEALAGFNNRPYDPDLKRGLCQDCGTRASKGDLFCRQCGSHLTQLDEVEETFRLFTKRRVCRNQDCGSHRVRVRRFLPAAIVETPSACGVCGDEMADE